MNDLIQAFEEFTKMRRGDGLVVVTVTALDLVKYVFDAVDGDGNTYLEVRMNAAEGKAGIIPVPAVNSSALITDLGNQAQEWVMVSAHVLREVYLIVDDVHTIHIDSKKVRLTGDVVQTPAVLGGALNTNLAALIAALTTLNTALTTFAAANLTASAGVLAPLAPAYSALNAALPGVASSLATVQGQLTNHLSANVSLS